MIGEVKRLLDQAVEIDLPALAALAARMHEHTLDDAVRAPPVLGDLFEVAGQHVDDLVDLGALLVAERRQCRCRGFLQLVQQFARQTGKVVDEVERVLDLVGDAGGQLPQGGHLLGLDQACLGRLELLECGRDRAARLFGRIAGAAGPPGGRFRRFRTARAASPPCAGWRRAQAKPDRAPPQDDRNALCRLARGECGGAIRHDNVDRQGHQFGRQLWEKRVIAVAEAELEDDVAALDVTQLVKSLFERLEDRRFIVIRGRQNADARHPPSGLLVLPW